MLKYKIGLLKFKRHNVTMVSNVINSNVLKVKVKVHCKYVNKL